MIEKRVSRGHVMMKADVVSALRVPPLTECNSHSYSLISVRVVLSACHILELTSDYPVFTMVMVIYYYVWIFWRVLVTPKCLYNIYDNENILSR